MRSKRKRASFSRITAEFLSTVECSDKEKTNVRPDEASSLSALNASVTRKYCPGQIFNGEEASGLLDTSLQTKCDDDIR